MANNILKQLLRKCIAKKANERKRKQPKTRRSASPTVEAQRDDGIIVIPQYRRPAEGSDSNPLPPPIVLDATHSDVTNPISRPSTRTISRGHNKQKAEANNDPSHCEEMDSGEVECIELIDEQPGPASGHFSQDLVFDVPTLKERLAMDKVKRKEEKKEERKKEKEKKKAAKIEKKQHTREEKHVVKCIAKKQRGRKQPKHRRSASPTVEAQRDNGIIVIPQYRRPAEGSDSNPLPPPIVLDATHSDVANPIPRPSTRMICRGHKKQKAEASNDPPHCEEMDSEELECIELTDEQPVPASGHFPQDLVFDVPTLKERLAMDKVKRKKEKKEERKKEKEEKKAAKIEKHQHILEEKRVAKLNKQEEIQKQREEKEVAKLAKEKQLREKKRADLEEYFKQQDALVDDVAASEKEQCTNEAAKRWRAMKISKLEAEIAKLETKVERLQEKNAERLKEMSCLEQQRIRVTVLDQHKPTTLMKDYELQFARQSVQRDHDITTRDIKVLKNAIAKKQSKLEKVKNYSRRVAPTKRDIKPAEPDCASDDLNPKPTASSGVTVVKECTSEQSSLSSLPKLYPRGFLSAPTPYLYY